MQVHKHTKLGASLANAEQLFLAGLLSQAEENCSIVLTQQPYHGKCWHLLGHIRMKLQDFKGAQIAFEKAASFLPEDAFVQADWGNILRKLMRLDDALDCYQRALQLKPDFWTVHYNKANTLRDLRLNQEAVESYLLAIAFKPDLAEAYTNMANAQRDCGLLEDARAALQKALQLQPSLHAAQYNLALCELELQDFEAAWVNFSARWKMPDFLSRHNFDHFPKWSPEFNGQNLLIWAEQGLGDEIFWAGLLCHAHTLAPEVWVQVDARLVPLMSRSYPLLKWIGGRENLPRQNFDAQMPMGDLGLIFRNNLQDFNQTLSPYLRVNECRVAEIRQDLRIKKNKICGISWRSQNPRTGADKSLSLLDFLPLLRLPGWTFVNLQYGDVSAEVAALMHLYGIELINFKEVDNFHDVDGLAHLIKACDVVVTTSNSTAHLAGAVAQQTFLIAPGGRGRMWYWMNRKTSQSLWYPTISLVDESGWGHSSDSNPFQSMLNLVEAFQRSGLTGD